jgi:hypothetical protein
MGLLEEIEEIRELVFIAGAAENYFWDYRENHNISVWTKEAIRDRGKYNSTPKKVWREINVILEEMILSGQIAIPHNTELQDTGTNPPSERQSMFNWFKRYARRYEKDPLNTEAIIGLNDLLERAIVYYNNVAVQLQEQNCDAVLQVKQMAQGNLFTECEQERRNDSNENSITRR